MPLPTFPLLADWSWKMISSAPTNVTVMTNRNLGDVKFLGQINNYSDVPPFETTLSHGNKAEITIGIDKKNAILVAVLNKKQTVIISLPREQGTPVWFHVVNQIRQLGFDCVGAYSCAPEILSLLIKEHGYSGTNLERNQVREDKAVFENIISGSEQIEWFRHEIKQCIAVGATDIHVETKGDVASLRIRRDGIVRLFRQYPAALCTKALAAYYTLLAEERSRSEVAFNVHSIQSAMIPIKIDGKGYALRYQSHPSVGGYEVVMRILKTDENNSSSPLSLEKLGYTPDQITSLNDALGSAAGGVFIAGVTGSGKTTTLSAMLTRLAREQNRKIVAIEDPVEYVVPGVSHLSIQRSAGGGQGTATDNPFSASMMAFLRMDPDIGMFGEIRDAVSGGMAYTAIQTGHKLLTTVHATSSIGIVARLASPQIGLQRSDICTPEFFSALVYQSLAPLNCIHCNVPAKEVMSIDQLMPYEQHFQIDIDNLRCASHEGCEHCSPPDIKKNEVGHNGIKGMKVSAEVLVPDDEMWEMLRNNQDLKARDYWRKQRTHAYTDSNMTGKPSWAHTLYDMTLGKVDPYYFEHIYGSPAQLAKR